MFNLLCQKLSVSTFLQTISKNIKKLPWCFRVPHSFARERRVCTRKNERRRGERQKTERQIGPREGEGEEGGYQNEISQANKYSVIAGNRVIARYGAERRGFSGCGSPIHPRSARTARCTREPAYPFTWRVSTPRVWARHTAYIRPNKVEVWSAEIASGGSYVRRVLWATVVPKFLVLSWSETLLKDRWCISNDRVAVWLAKIR